jgi:protoheme IX farnesyltransferase
MFAVEGTAMNLYALKIASDFKEDRSNSGARRIFLMSLWYLPLLMTGMIFHASTWENNLKEEASAEEVSTRV